MQTTSMLTFGHLDILERRPHLKVLGYSDESCGFDYQPGDGTRYNVRFNKLSASEASALGCTQDSLLMVRNTGPNTFVGMTVSAGTHPFYIKEKLGCVDRTATVLADLIDFVFNATDVGPSLYETGEAR
jgi:hypothetical protein